MKFIKIDSCIFNSASINYIILDADEKTLIVGTGGKDRVFAFDEPQELAETFKRINLTLSSVNVL